MHISFWNAKKIMPIDSRVIIVIVFFAFGWIITGGIQFLYHSTIHTDEISVFHEIFVAWSGELLFFTAVGLAVAIISIKEPTDPRTQTWRERVQILFGLSSVPDCVTEFHRKTLEEIARYAANGNRLLTIEDYNKSADAYRVRIDHNYDIVNALHDTDLTERLAVRITPDELDKNIFNEAGKVLSIKAGLDEKITSFTPIPFEGLFTEFDIPLPAGKKIPITVSYEMWMRCGELQTQRAIRFIEKIEMRFISRLAASPTITVKGDARGTLTLLPNQVVVGLTAQAIEPRGVLAEFTLQSPPIPASHHEANVADSGLQPTG
jgi:hypothetical protein